MSCTWLTRQEAADYLRISTAGLRKWDREGKSKPFKNGHVVRYCLTELLEIGGKKEVIETDDAD